VFAAQLKHCAATGTQNGWQKIEEINMNGLSFYRYNKRKIYLAKN
jgi:hypothetical protein